MVCHGLVGNKGGIYYSFQNLGSWHANKPDSQVTILCVFNLGMSGKKSNRLVKIKAKNRMLMSWNRHYVFSLESTCLIDASAVSRSSIHIRVGYYTVPSSARSIEENHEMCARLSAPRQEYVKRSSSWQI
jgi:hypothetical protein